MDCQRAVGKSQKAVPEQTAGQALAAYGAQKERFTAAQAFDFFQVEAVGEVKETNRKHSAQTNNQACLHAPRKRRADGCDWRHPGYTAVGQVQQGGKPENPPDAVGTAQADAHLQGKAAGDASGSARGALHVAEVPTLQPAQQAQW
jgi:hypothetical protein